VDGLKEVQEKTFRNKPYQYKLQYEGSGNMSKGLPYGVGIFIPVSELDRSTTWYKEMLDFEILHTDEPLANVLKMGNGVVIFCL
jgi:hypothetical protein